MQSIDDVLTRIKFSVRSISEVRFLHLSKKADRNVGRSSVRKRRKTPFANISEGVYSSAVRDKKRLSRFCTKCVLHAKLRNFPARVESEVSVMAKRTLTKHEREVAAVVEQALHTMIETDLTVADIMDAAVQSARRRSDATTLR